MKIAFVTILAISCIALGGCLLGDFYKKPEGGGKSTAEVVQTIARGLPYGDIISGAIGILGLAVGANGHVKHRKSKKENVILKQKLAAVTPPPVI